MIGSDEVRSIIVLALFACQNKTKEDKNSSCGSVRVAVYQCHVSNISPVTLYLSPVETEEPF